MITYRGERVYPENDGFPLPETVGVSLGRIARFNGHTTHWYPVLGHVLVVAQILPDRSAVHGLLHDAPEVCCADVPTPWKTQVARNREHRLLKRIYEGWGLPWPISDEIQAQVDWADEQALMAEAHVLGHPAADEFWPNPDQSIMERTAQMLDLAPNFLNAELASEAFTHALQHYTELAGLEVAAA